MTAMVAGALVLVWVALFFIVSAKAGLFGGNLLGRHERLKKLRRVNGRK